MMSHGMTLLLEKYFGMGIPKKGNDPFVNSSEKIV